jgi:hypothetical protein
MSKLTALAIGLLTVISIAPNSQAFETHTTSAAVQKPAGDLHAQVIIKIGGNSDYSYRGGYDRHREIELERERELYRRRRSNYYSNRRNYRDGYRDGYYQGNNEYRGKNSDEYRGEYRRNH